MRIVSRQYRSTEIPASLEEPLVSQAAIDRALNPYWDKLLVNPSLTQIIGFTDR